MASYQPSVLTLVPAPLRVLAAANEASRVSMQSQPASCFDSRSFFSKLRRLCQRRSFQMTEGVAHEIDGGGSFPISGGGFVGEEDGDRSKH